MKGLKSFIVILIIISTAAAILYLVYQAKRLERYTVAPSDETVNFLIYSSKSATFKNGRNIGELLKYIRDQLKDLGYGVLIIDYKNKETFDRDADKKIKEKGQYILIDLGLSNLVINKNTILIRTEFNSSDKSRKNKEFANLIKKRLENENIKVNVLQDSTNNWNGELGYRSLRIEISDKCNISEGERLIDILLK